MALMDIITVDFKEKLIAAVRRHPCIYNTSLREHTIIRYRENAWENIAKELGSTVNTTKTVFTTLRQQFSREMNKFEVDAAGYDGEPLSNWYFYKQMRFLTPFMKRVRNGVKRHHPSSNATNPTHDMPFELKVLKTEPTTDEEIMLRHGIMESDTDEEKGIPHSGESSREDRLGEMEGINVSMAAESSSNADPDILACYSKIIEQKLRALPPVRAEKIALKVIMDLNDELFQ
ncbi:uncharacterized protein LOC129790932 isoform X1 [Lutzomyia longipalpis]|uniref:uncharacterized protein LOC129790932 isoform X1 n=1 Tax=Lutzomyia longipalpis TaxID=7200 RepID=UPI0024833183|nr:uncharacterized protein LOC129790932 isoform X1 [Lutzomyia longipalpis]